MLTHFPPFLVSTAIHTIAHYYNYERFVAFRPRTNAAEFGLDSSAFVPAESTVDIPDNTVSDCDCCIRTTICNSLT